MFLVLHQFVSLGMFLDHIIGHNLQKKTLVESLSSERIPHAQLFEGDDESGVLAVALAYANAVVSGDNSSNNATSLKANALVHPDIHFVFPTATTAEVKSKPAATDFGEPWREFVKENPYGSLYDWVQFLGIENKQAVIGVADALDITKKVGLTSFEGGWKCVIIWHAEKMTTSAANKLLKSIEEPPAKTLFILVCPDENQLLSTIRSRCQKTHFGKVKKADVVGHLVSRRASQATAEAMTTQAGGVLGKAVRAMKEQRNQGAYEEWFVRWVRTAFKAKGNKAVVLDLTNWSQEIAANGVETQKQFLMYAISVFRAALLKHYKIDALSDFYISTGFKLEKFAPFVHGINIVPIIEAIEKSYYHLERNGNAQMIFTDLSFSLTRLLHKNAA